MENIFVLRERPSPVSERQLALLDALEDAIDLALQETDITVIEVIGLLRFVEASLLAGGAE
jgi:hypothetical protein